MKQAPTALLLQELTSQGLPVVGVALVNAVHDTVDPATFHTVSGRLVRLDWPAPPTVQQQSSAQAVMNAFDVRDRRPRSRSSLRADFQALSVSDRNRLIMEAVVDLLLRDPRVGQQLNIAINGDEPDV